MLVGPCPRAVHTPALRGVRARVSWGQGEGQLGSGQGSAWVRARVSEGQGEGQLGGLSQGRVRVRGGVGHKCSESSGFSSIPRL